MENNQTEPKPIAFADEERRHRDTSGLRRSATRVGLGSFAVPLSVLLTMVGSGLQGFANGTADALFMALLLLIAGIGFVKLVFPRGLAEMRVFMLTYGVCVLSGGLAQCYSLAVFDNPQSTHDAVYSFFQNISPKPPFATLADYRRLLDSTLPIVIWQQVYKLTWLLGFDFGPYTGVMFNAFVMGMTGSLTVRTARELFGNDAWRLRRVGTLFAFCGLFILFGSILIRDCFTTFLNALVLWGIVRWLVRSTPKNLLFAIVLTGGAAFGMVFFRDEAVGLFGLFWLLALLLWYSKKKLNITRIFAMVLAICILLIGSGSIIEYVHFLKERGVISRTKYNELSAIADTGDSLGMQFVINQPLPIRLILGSSFMMISPIPLWRNFKIGSNDYCLIKGYNGIYQLLLIPLLFAGYLAVYRSFHRNRKQAATLTFLALYILLSLAAVVATSLEQRHLAQFMPAIMVLVALPDTRNRKVRTEVQLIAGLWFAVVVLVHVAWAAMKG